MEKRGSWVGRWHRRGALALLGLTLVAPGFSAPAHYLVFEMDGTGWVEPVFSRQVDLASAPVSRPQAEMEAVRAAGWSQERPRLAVRLEGPDGRAVHQDVIELPRWIRGEFHGRSRGKGWEIDAHQVPAGRRAFVVRVPAAPGARLVMEGLLESSFSLDELAARSEELPLAKMAGRDAQVRAAALTGSPGNRVDILILGDGYTAAEEALFDSHVDEFNVWFFTVTPYAEYQNFVNVSSLFVASAESGADHPPYDAACPGGLGCCSDPDALFDPLAGTYVDTAFDARFCASNIHRLLVVDEAAIFAAAAAVPDWDHIMVAVNDPVYGGSGGAIAVTSVHEDGLEIIQHEYGHSFTRLADEYDTPYPGFPACSDMVGPACEANVTDETSPSLIKWSPWIAPATPLPTPEGSPLYAAEVGLFQGARYLTTGMYRPRDEACMMHFLGLSSCEICSQEYVRRLYGGGWGAPWTGIDAIEPGSENPPVADAVDGTAGAVLSVALLQPVGSPPLAVSWLVDGAPQPPQAGQPPGTYDFTPPGPGTYSVDVLVEDVTPLVHPAMAGPLLQTSRTWTVQAGPVSPGRAALLAVRPSATTPGNLVLSWGPSCSPDALNHAIYEGTLGVFYSHTRLDCSDDGEPLTEEIVPSPGNTYYLVVPLSLGEEGSYGLSTAAGERPPGTATCRPARVPSACP